MSDSQKLNEYIQSLPDWQREICQNVRRLIHEAEPEIQEEIKFTNRPYFTYKGNVCALLAAKNHVNVFIYDPIVPDPAKLINQGHANATARSIQIYKNETLNDSAFVELIKAVASNNRKGGWRKLSKTS